MFRRLVARLSLALVALILIISLLNLPTLAQQTFTPVDGPITQSDVLQRVKLARASQQDFDDIAADIDRRGIEFAVDENFTNQLRFMRAMIVSNALWRADERRKALLVRPKNEASLEGLNEAIKKDLKTLSFIEQAREVSLAYVSLLPNFIVREQVQRYERPSGKSWKLGDYLELAVSYASGRGEEVKLKLQNGRAASTDLDKIGGLTSTGQFAGQLESLFNQSSQTEFVEQGNIDFYGQPCVVYAYSVATKNSQQHLKIGNEETIVGYRGHLFINKETKQILRLEQEAVDIPFGFPVTKATSVVDFGWVTITGKDFLLPVNAQVALTSKQDNYTALNCITFSKYGKFDTDVKILEQP